MWVATFKAVRSRSARTGKCDDRFGKKSKSRPGNQFKAKPLSFPEHRSPMLCPEKAPLFPPGGAFACRPAASHQIALFAQMSQYRGNRWSDLVDRGQQRIMRYVETIGPIVSLGRVADVDHGRGCDTSLRGDHRSDCCETDHRLRISRFRTSPNGTMTPALTKRNGQNCALNARFNQIIQLHQTARDR
jgi:hypothetical protein